jgi:hypothetical protein
VTLARDVVPEFQVTSGKRRLSGQQVPPLKQLGIYTPDVIEREKWNAFWDAPLSIPGASGSNQAIDLPRKPEEVRRAWATYHATGCEVKSDGARIEVTVPGLDLGIFHGRLQYTAYRGVNLLRQEAIAQTDEPSVAYKYVAGLKGFRINDDTRVMWRDTARAWQDYEFGGAPNTDAVALKARNRLAIVEEKGGSVAFFPPSHKFFFSREMETNLGYVYYRKDDAQSFAVGVRQVDREEGFKPDGVSDAVWKHRVSESREELDNFALYNAPPGTWQRMPVYFYLSPENGIATQQDVMAYTHDDVYKAMPGFKVLVSHFHFHLNEELSDQGSIDYRPPWVSVFRALGINVAILADFHSDSHPGDTGKIRLDEQKVYFEGSERLSDRNVLVIPGEEPDANFGGHYMFVFPQPLYFTHVMGRRNTGPAQPFVETIPGYARCITRRRPPMNSTCSKKSTVWCGRPIRAPRVRPVIRTP